MIALEADHAHEVLSLNGTEALSVHVYSRRSVRSDSERSRRQPELALMRLPWATVFWRRPSASGSIACPVTLELPGRSRWAIVTIGTLDELRRNGCLTGKVGTQPICVFWSDGTAYALDDRCPHMGFPLHRGSVESGLVTCHWRNARFDLSSGGTLDPWADDVRTYPVDIDDDGRVIVVVEPEAGRSEYLLRRLDEGLEQGITLVVAKAVLGLLDIGVRPERDRARRRRFRRAIARRWGAGLTVLTSMANVLPHLDRADHGLALVHGMTFVSRDTRGRAPRFPAVAARW